MQGKHVQGTTLTACKQSNIYKSNFDNEREKQGKRYRECSLHMQENVMETSNTTDIKSKR